MSKAERILLGERLRKAREYVGLSQEDVALHLGVPRTAVTQMEKGNRRIDATELSKLAALLQCSAAHLLGEAEEDGTGSFELLRRATSSLSEKDQEQVLRFAEFLRSKDGAKS